jgi:hypothetical protein
MLRSQKIAALEKSFAGPYAAHLDRLRELRRMCDFLSGYLRARGYQGPYLPEGFKDLGFRARIRCIIDGPWDDPGIAEARNHMPRTKAEWQAYEADPEGYLRACVERERAGV